MWLQSAVLVTVVCLVYGQSTPDELCLTNEGCPSDRVCEKNKCFDPCQQKICDGNAICSVSNHITVCWYKKCSCEPPAGDSVVKSGVKKYRISNHTLSWYNAVAHCSAEGMSLASIESQEEQDMVVELIKRSRDLLWAWIGGYNLLQEGRLVWNSTGQPLTFTNFAEGQPDKKIMRGDQEKCLSVGGTKYNYKWYDDWCFYYLTFICQYYE